MIIEKMSKYDFWHLNSEFKKDYLFFDSNYYTDLCNFCFMEEGETKHIIKLGRNYFLKNYLK